jgi:thiol-disulfide isomerase/thioredoxin
MVASVVLIGGLVYAVDTAAERAKQVAAVDKEFNDAYEKFGKAMESAKTEKDRNAALKLQPNVAAYIQKLLPVLKADAKDDAAFTALCWVIDHDEDDANAPQVFAWLEEHHRTKPTIVRVLWSVEGVSPPAEKFIRAVIKDNTDKTAQGVGHYQLANLLQNKVENGTLNEEAIAKANTEAEQLLTVVNAKFADLPASNQPGDMEKLGAAAKKRLFELQNLAVGKLLPEFTGKDLDDKPRKLSAYKGKVLVIDVWATWCGPCRALIPHQRELVKKHKDAPFALLSISGDDNKADLTDFIKKEPMPWDHWFNGQGGIVEAWNIQAYPTLFIVDAKGVIRGKNVRDPHELDKLVDKLVAEAKGK